MADPVDLEALDRLYDPTPSALRSGLEVAYPALREEIVSLREKLQRNAEQYRALRWWREVFACRVGNLPPEGSALLGVRWKLVDSDRELADRRQDEAREHLRRVVHAAHAVDAIHKGPQGPQIEQMRAALAAVPPELLEEARE